MSAWDHQCDEPKNHPTPRLKSPDKSAQSRSDLADLGLRPTDPVYPTIIGLNLVGLDVSVDLAFSCQPD